MSDIQRMQVYKRGQVWMVTENEEVSSAKVKCNDKTMCYTHPYLIMTDDAYLNGDELLITGYPITSNVATSYRDDLVFVNHRGEKNKIRCREIQTRDIKYFKYYMFTVPDDIMQEVECILLNRLGLSSLTSALTKQYSNPNEIPHQGQSLKSLVPATTLSYDAKPQTFADLIVDETEKVNSPKTRVISRQRRWDDRTATKFFNDYNEHTFDELAQMYDTTTSSIHKLKHYLKVNYPDVYKNVCKE